jgi:Flp pilus assembly protein TadD
MGSYQMRSVSEMFQLAWQYYQGGNLQQAELLYTQILLVDPQHVDALHLLGVIARLSGRSDLAVDYFRRALRLRPTFPEAHNNLGNALKDQGKFDEAISSYQQALGLKPNYAEAHNNLGNALAAQGKLDEAITSYRHALRLNPNYAKALNYLGNALTEQGKLDEAIASFQQALRLTPNYAEALNNLGNALTAQGKLEEAIANYEQALRLKPNIAEVLNNLGNALALHEKLDEAIIIYRRALSQNSHNAATLLLLGKALKDQGKFDEAITSYRQALRVRPNDAEAHNDLGLALTELGRPDEAIASLREALRWQPKHAAALGQLASLLRGKLPDADRAIVELRLAEPGLNDPDRIKLLFGLAAVCDAKGEYAPAATLLQQANALSLSLPRQKGQTYDLHENARFVRDLIAAFTPAFFERVRGFGLDTERPVFIVGLPRSGTTLTEQILAAHSQVYGAGELTLGRKDFLALGTQPTTDSAFATLPLLPGDAIRRLAERHLDQLATMNRTAARVVDKMPNNFWYMGVLAALFPKAKFIHCRRDLRDVAVSWWMTPSVQWAKDPELIVARFRDYQKVMHHWRTVLPVSILEVQYEETVADLQGVARRLVEWCGLDWEPACLKFNEANRPVRTPSKMQVREPVYTRSVARWRNYEQDLGELFAALQPLQASGT